MLCAKISTRKQKKKVFSSGNCRNFHLKKSITKRKLGKSFFCDCKGCVVCLETCWIQKNSSRLPIKNFCPKSHHPTSFLPAIQNLFIYLFLKLLPKVKKAEEEKLNIRKFIFHKQWLFNFLLHFIVT